jgi:Tfp pilus assembly protein PilV
MSRFSLVINDRGDTLIEVTIALAIMAAVLTTSFLLSEKSIQLGVIAKERTLMVSAAQQQAETLTASRDRVGWASFVNNIRSSLGTSSCRVGGQQCFHVDASNLRLINNTVALSAVPTSQIYITTNTVLSPTPNLITFIINYVADAPGSGPQSSSQIILELGDTDGLRQVAP